MLQHTFNNAFQEVGRLASMLSPNQVFVVLIAMVFVIGLAVVMYSPVLIAHEEHKADQIAAKSNKKDGYDHTSHSSIDNTTNE